MNELNVLLSKHSAGILGGSIEKCIVAAYDDDFSATATNAAEELAALRSRIEDLEAENERLKKISRTASELAHVVIEDDIIVNNVDVCESCKYRARKIIEEYRKEQK